MCVYVFVCYVRCNSYMYTLKMKSIKSISIIRRIALFFNNNFSFMMCCVAADAMLIFVYCVFIVCCYKYKKICVQHLSSKFRSCCSQKYYTHQLTRARAQFINLCLLLLIKKVVCTNVARWSLKIPHITYFICAYMHMCVLERRLQ